MGIGQKIKDWIFEPVVDENENIEQNYSTSHFETRESSGVIEKIGENDVIAIRPRKYQDASEILNHLKGNRAVIINLSFIQAELAQRILDFVYGGIYSLDGEMQKISPNVFLCTPRTMGIANIFPGPSDDDDTEGAYR